jgi:hypothetical protein
LVAGVGPRVAVSPPRAQWFAAGVVVSLASVAMGAVGYQVRARLAPPAIGGAPASSIVETVRPQVTPAPTGDLPAVVSVAAPTASPRIDQGRSELRLLRQARAAVAREDYAAALPPIAEHARRFKGGRLAEEREALRVKALVGVGRIDEAQRAAADFRLRFARSVLLSVVSELSPPAEP